MTGSADYREKAARYRQWAAKAKTPESAKDLEGFARHYEEMAAQAEAFERKVAQPA